MLFFTLFTFPQDPMYGIDIFTYMLLDVYGKFFLGKKNTLPKTKGWTPKTKGWTLKKDVSSR